MHDGLGQSLTGIGYLIGAVQQALLRKSAPEAAELEIAAKLHIAVSTVESYRAGIKQRVICVQA